MARHNHTERAADVANIARARVGEAFDVDAIEGSSQLLDVDGRLVVALGGRDDAAHRGQGSASSFGDVAHVRERNR